jgi:hypothetical protein
VEILYKRVLAVFQTTNMVTLVLYIIYDTFHVVQICTITNYPQKQITELIDCVILKILLRCKHSEDNSYLEIKLAVCILLSLDVCT